MTWLFCISLILLGGLGPLPKLHTFDSFKNFCWLPLWGRIQYTVCTAFLPLIYRLADPTNVVEWGIFVFWYFGVLNVFMAEPLKMCDYMLVELVILYIQKLVTTFVVFLAWMLFSCSLVTFSYRLLGSSDWYSTGDNWYYCYCKLHILDLT